MRQTPGFIPAERCGKDSLVLHLLTFHNMKKLAVVTTHPIQYHVPWFIRIAEKNIKIKVFYTWEQSEIGFIYDPGFGHHIRWDIPMLDGYDYEFVKNTARRPGVNHFRGIVNPELIGKIEEWAPDGLMVIGWNHYTHLQCLRHFHHKLPIYFRGDSVLLHERTGWRKLFRRLFLTWVYKHVDYALYVGSNNKSYYLRHGLKNNQLVFSPQAIDIERFAEPDAVYAQQAQERKEELGIPKTDLTVLYAGKMTTIKNPFFILDLADACRDLPVSFILVGDGHLKEGLMQRAEDKPKVHFMSFQNQTIMPAIYRMGDVFIMPSLSETWGMAINEAMACGKPAIASEKVGCAADLVLEGKTGIVFKLGDLDKCVAFIREVCGNRERLVEMGVNAKSLVQFFSFAHIVDSIGRVMGLPPESGLPKPRQTDLFSESPTV
jgi:glycosyltransferase involved in cell wall biosynthesis